MEWHRDHDIALDGLVVKTLGEVSRQLISEVEQPAELESLDYPVQGRLIAPGRE